MEQKEVEEVRKEERKVGVEGWRGSKKGGEENGVEGSRGSKKG